MSINIHTHEQQPVKMQQKCSKYLPGWQIRRDNDESVGQTASGIGE